MKLLSTRNLLLEGRIDTKEAAKLLEVEEQTIKNRLKESVEATKKLLGVLDLISADKITRGQAAEILGVSERQVNIYMRKWRVTRPVSSYLVEAANAEVKWEVRKKFAADFIGMRVLSLQEAADSAEVSTRQMRRWISSMLIKHCSMQYRDLLVMSPMERVRLANKILEGERLEEEKQRLANAIAFGSVKMTSEALDRAKEAKKTHTVKKKFFKK